MPFTLPRKSSAIAGGLATVLTLGLLAVSAQPASAFAGSVAANAMGLSANLSLLSGTPGGVAPYSVANYPAGPAGGTAVPLSVSGVASTGVLATDVTGSPKDDTATASSQVNGLNLVSGLVTADSVGSTCTAGPGGTTASAAVTNLKGLGSLLTVPATIAPNTQVPVRLLGINIATITLNEQIPDTTPGEYGITVRALHLQLIGGVLGSVGTGDVVVGESTCTSTVPTQPVVSSVSPAAGPVAGGTTVTIDGADLLAVTSVKFDGVAATSFTRVSPTRVTAVTPAHAAGPVTVSVGNVAGEGTRAGGFTYRPAPVVTGISPAVGPTVGGTGVTITGTGFDDITGVTFAGTPATFVRNSSTRITATAPAGTGTADVAVTGAGGTSANTSADNFSYLAAPTLSGISPAFGPTTGGGTVTLTGSNFTAGSTVGVDGVQVTPTVQSATTMTVTMPAHVAGSAPVVVTTAGGSTSAQAFSYLLVPVVTGITPMWGPDAGGTTVTVTGTGLAGVTSVDVDGTNRPVSNQSGTSLQFTTPAHTAGATTVTLNGPGAATTTAGTFTFTLPASPSAPTITSLSPEHAQAGSLVTVSGTGFTAGATVTFDGVPASSVLVLGPTSLLAGVPSGSGIVPVLVSTPAGTSTPNAASTFTYPPVVISISPDNGPVAGGTTVTITGTGFTPGTVVLIDGVPVEPTFVSGSLLSVVLPAHAAGDVDLAVQLNGVTSGKTTLHYVAGTGTTPTTSPTSSPTSSPTTSPTSSPTGDPTSTPSGTSIAVPTSRPTQDGNADPTSDDVDSGNVDATDSATGSGDGTTINGDGAAAIVGSGSGNGPGNGSGNGSGADRRDPQTSAPTATTRTSAAGTGAEAGDGGVTAANETGVFNSALHSRLGWLLLLALLAALAAGYAFLGGAWRRRAEARRLADALEKYWAGVGPAVASEAVAVIRIPRLGEDWRWPVYPMTGPEVLKHGIALNSGDLLGAHPGELELAGLASSPFHALPHLPQMQAGDPISVITPDRILTYRATGGGTGGAVASWGASTDEGTRFTLSSCAAGGRPDDSAKQTTLRAVLERINHRTMNSEAPLAASSGATDV